MALETVDLGVWKERIKSGQRYQQEFAQSNKWTRYKDYYRHKFAEGIVPVNLMFSVLRSLVPQVAFRLPRINVMAENQPGLKYELHARIVQKIDNWLLRELGAKLQFKRLIGRNFFTGLGVGFHGYSTEEFSRNGRRIEFNQGKKVGLPWFVTSRTEDVVFPYGTSGADDLRWVAFRVFKTVRDIKGNSLYSNTDKLSGNVAPVRTNPNGAVPPEGQSLAQAMQAEPEDMQWVELWQAHDLETGRVVALTMDHEKFLRNEEDDSQIEGSPCETLCFNPDEDSIYGIPDARIIEPQLLELNDIRTQSMKHRRVSVAKMLARKNALSPEEKQKLMNENVQAIVEVEADVGITEAVMPFNPGVSGILNDLAMQAELARADVREMVGFSRNASGEFQGKTHVSAEETKRVFQSLNIRLDERRDQMADLLVNVVRKWNQYIFKNWTVEQVTDIVGPDGAKWWLKFTGPEIRGEYAYSVDVEEGIPMDTATRLKMATDAAQAWANMNMGAVKSGMPVPMEIQRVLFSNIKGIDSDKLIAQIESMNRAMMGARQSSGAAALGASPEAAVSPDLMAQVMQGRMR